MFNFDLLLSDDLPPSDFVFGRNKAGKQHTWIRNTKSTLISAFINTVESLWNRFSNQIV